MAMPVLVPALQTISLRDVGEGRVWCPLAGGRSRTPDGAFAPESRCIGPACGVWTWRDAGEAAAAETRRCHLVPLEFGTELRLRLVVRTLPDLIEPFRVLAGDETADTVAARATILAWACRHWQPEGTLPDPAAWQRQAAPFWDPVARMVALDLVRVRTDDQRCGTCGLGRANPSS